MVSQKRHRDIIDGLLYLELSLGKESRFQLHTYKVCQDSSILSFTHRIYVAGNILEATGLFKDIVSYGTFSDGPLSEELAAKPSDRDRIF